MATEFCPHPDSLSSRHVKHDRKDEFLGSHPLDLRAIGREAGRALGEGFVTSRTVTVVNVLGMHARAAARFVRLASSFASQVRVNRNGRVIDGKSIMGLLLLAASRGVAITISVDGPDEAAAIEALCALVERGFDDDAS